MGASRTIRTESSQMLETDRKPAILVLYAHPRSHDSRVNRLLMEAARALPNVTVQDLYETYPDFYIDVQREQALMEAADLVVFQHPVQWYGMPSLLKEWVDVVLEAGWAYGKNGTALQGKGFWLAVTTGSPADAYQAGGLHERPFEAFLPAFKQTAQLCGMRWQAPLVQHGAHQLSDAALALHVERYADLLSRWPQWRDREPTAAAAFPSVQPIPER